MLCDIYFLYLYFVKYLRVTFREDLFAYGFLKDKFFTQDVYFTYVCVHV